MKRGDERGVALMLVLWLILMMGFVAVAVITSARAQSQVIVNVRARTIARYAAESGIVAAAARLEQLLQASRSATARALIFRELNDRVAGLSPSDLGGAKFEVAAADLNARIDLNGSDETTLSNLFAQFVDEREARLVTAALLDWTDRDALTRPDGAEAADYLAAGSPYLPANGPLRHLEEFRRVLGVTDRLAYAVAEHVTVHSDGMINLNTAPETVLAALPGLGRDGARLLVERRERGEVFTSSAVIRQILRERRVGPEAPRFQRTTSAPSRILIISRGWEEGLPLTHEIQAVYAIDAQDRLVLVAWEERGL